MSESTKELYKRIKVDAETLLLQLRELHAYRFRKESAETLLALYALYLNGQERVSAKTIDLMVNRKCLTQLHILASKQLVHTLPPELPDATLLFELDSTAINLISLFIPFSYQSEAQK